MVNEILPLSKSPKRENEPMTDNEKENTIRSYITAYNNFDIEGMVALVHPELMFKNISAGQIDAQTQGIEDFRQLANQSKDLFSSRHQKARRFEFAADVVKVDIAFEGVLAMDLPNGMKRGEVLQLTGRSEFEFKDEKIYKITDVS